MRSIRIQIVTSTRIAQRNGRGREGDKADRKPVERANRVLVTADLVYVSQRELLLAPSPHLIRPSWQRLVEWTDGWICEDP
jgi:hypothetical protein